MDTTTLYASDRDVFLFLVDAAHLVEAWRLPNGDPDLYFRGFYCWNSEVGSKTLGMASFYLRTVCMNRHIWGAEGFEESSIRHSKFAGHRFAHQAAPALERFATSSPAPFMAGIKAAREAIVARKDEDRETFLHKRGFSRPETEKIIATVLEEEGRPSWRRPMTKSVQKITLSSLRDIPFDKLLLSQSNVRHIKAGVSIEELAEDIARRTLLQSVIMRPVRQDRAGTVRRA
jgi:hypothetical protein